MANWYDNVPAPVDVNGRVVPLDTKELVYDGKVFRIGGLEYLKYRNVGCAWVADLVGLAPKVPLNICTLPDSWEQLEEDAAKGLCGYFGMDDAPDCKGCPAYANRLSCDCNIKMASDLVRRAKALAGVTDDE